MNKGGVLLSINAGSSSLKVAVFDATQLESPISSVSIEGIGTDTAAILPDGNEEAARHLPIATAREAVEVVKQWLSNDIAIASDTVLAIGYRVVHGGERFTEATRITPTVLEYLDTLTPLAPNHMPSTLSVIAAFQAAYPSTDHVACFDTSFFSDIPEVAKTLPLPQEYDIRRFGFHGLSYSSLLESFRQHEGETAACGRVIMAHLGSGASVSALKNGRPVDMSMGFTPVSGIMMSTRSGDIEPEALTYLQREKGLSVVAISELVSRKSGLLGVSGVSAEMHTLLAKQHEDNQVALAVELFCYKVKKQIGAYAAVLGGVDSLIFSGGIGERSAEIRQRICADLSFLGIIIDEKRNQHNERLISEDGAGVGVHVIPAREDVSIVRQTYSVLKGAL
jgi:acetate kinase